MAHAHPPLGFEPEQTPAQEHQHTHEHPAPHTHVHEPVLGEQSLQPWPPPHEAPLPLGQAQGLGEQRSFVESAGLLAIGALIAYIFFPRRK